MNRAIETTAEDREKLAFLIGVGTDDAYRISGRHKDQVRAFYHDLGEWGRAFILRLIEVHHDGQPHQTILDAAQCKVCGEERGSYPGIPT